VGLQFDHLTITLLILRSDAPQLSEEAAAALQNAHVAHIADLHEAGYLVASGPLPDARFRGLSVFTIGPEQTRALMEQDPAVCAGRFSVEIMSWLVPAGAMAFSPAHFPRSMAEAEGD
jgi:uncharacterized protein YciI